MVLKPIGYYILKEESVTYEQEELFNPRFKVIFLLLLSQWFSAEDGADIQVIGHAYQHS